MVRFAPSLSNTAVLLEYKKLRPVLVVESMVVFITLYLGVALGDLCIFFYVINLAYPPFMDLLCVFLNMVVLSISSFIRKERALKA